jgi:hypothetical protein
MFPNGYSAANTHVERRLNVNEVYPSFIQYKDVYVPYGPVGDIDIRKQNRYLVQQPMQEIENMQQMDNWDKQPQIKQIEMSQGEKRQIGFDVPYGSVGDMDDVHIDFTKMDVKDVDAMDIDLRKRVLNFPFTNKQPSLDEQTAKRARRERNKLAHERYLERQNWEKKLQRYNMEIDNQQINKILYDQQLQKELENKQMERIQEEEQRQREIDEQEMELQRMTNMTASIANQTQQIIEQQKASLRNRKRENLQAARKIIAQGQGQAFSGDSIDMIERARINRIADDIIYRFSKFSKLDFPTDYIDIDEINNKFEERLKEISDISKVAPEKMIQIRRIKKEIGDVQLASKKMKMESELEKLEARNKKIVKSILAEFGNTNREMLESLSDDQFYNNSRILRSMMDEVGDVSQYASIPDHKDISKIRGLYTAEFARRYEIKKEMEEEILRTERLKRRNAKEMK